MRFREFVMASQRGEKLKQQLGQVKSLLANLFFVPSAPKASLAQTEARQTRAHDITEQFWTNPQSPIFGWLQSHGVPITPGVLPPFAQGGAGRAYFLGNNVVKMSANRVEANVAKMVAGRSDLPTPVIDVLYLDQNVYAILQHHVNTDIPREIAQAADLLTAAIDDHPEMQGWPNNKAEQETLCRETLQRNGGNASLLPYMLMLLEVLLSLYQATGFKHDDAGPTNLGMHQGKIVIPDLGPNQTGDFNQLDALAGIQKNRQSLGLPRHKSI